MTKVYVVLGHEPKTQCTWISKVFTNKKKANIFRDWISTMSPENKYEVKEEKVDKFDYGKLI